MKERKTGEEPRGFENMTSDERKAHGSVGGRVAHKRGTAHKFTDDERRKAVHTREARRRAATE